MGMNETFSVDPLTFFEHNASLYLYVRISLTDKIRTIAISRIKNIELTESIFPYPEDFNPDSLRQASFAMVENDPITARIWFSAKNAPYIKERRWSDKQTLKDQKDGSVILTLSTSGFDDVKHWILSYGAGAKALAPKALIEAIRKEVKGMKALYAVK
jgi:predicted DNA-binding transcriptional regulator YafY